MSQKLFTLDDLYNFCLQQQTSFSFDSHEKDDATLFIQTPGTLVFESGYDATEGLLKTHLKSCHIDKNRNGSCISRSSMEQAAPSICNRPILGYIHKLDNGEMDFGDHRMTIDENGEIEYQEIPVGVIPESCNYELIYDEKNGKTYLEADGYIYEQYTKAADILREKGEAKVSVEIAVSKFSFDSKKKLLMLEEICFRGITILGRREDGTVVQEGMMGSTISLTDFAEKQNSLSEQKRAIDLLEKIDLKLSNFNINIIQTKGGENLKLTELLEKYKVTESDVDFEAEGLSDEDLEKAFADKFDTDNASTDEEIEETISNSEDEVHDDETSEIQETEAYEKIVYSVTRGDQKVAEFEVSMNDICYSLSRLINDTYSEQDNAWYIVTTYNDHVIMEDYFSGTAYKQKYNKEKDSISLLGDRVEVFKNWLTSEEETSLKTMKESYTALEEKIKSYELVASRAEKKAVLKQEKYAALSETDEFIQLKSKMDSYSLEELTKEVKALHSDFVIENPQILNATFSDVKKKPRVAYGFSFEEKKKPYGTLFDKTNY